MIGIVPGTVVTVKTNKGDFRAKKLVLTTGAWTNSLLDTAGIGLNLKFTVHVYNILLFYRIFSLSPVCADTCSL